MPYESDYDTLYPSYPSLLLQDDHVSTAAYIAFRCDTPNEAVQAAVCTTQRYTLTNPERLERLRCIHHI